MTETTTFGSGGEKTRKRLTSPCNARSQPEEIVAAKRTKAKAESAAAAKQPAVFSASAPLAALSAPPPVRHRPVMLCIIATRVRWCDAI